MVNHKNCSHELELYSFDEVSDHLVQQSLADLRTSLAGVIDDARLRLQRLRHRKYEIRRPARNTVVGDELVANQIRRDVHHEARFYHRGVMIVLAADTRLLRDLVSSFLRSRPT